MRKRIIAGISSLLSFIIAVNIYTDLRGYDQGIFHWANLAFPLNLSPNWLNFLNAKTQTLILYNLPDGLWMFSLVLLILLVWNLNLHLLAGIWLLIAFTAGLFLEVLQSYKMIAGTFDWYDVYAYALALFLAITLAQSLKKWKWKNGKSHQKIHYPS